MAAAARYTPKKSGFGAQSKLLRAWHFLAAVNQCCRLWPNIQENFEGIILKSTFKEENRLDIDQIAFSKT